MTRDHSELIIYAKSGAKCAKWAEIKVTAKEFIY